MCDKKKRVAGFSLLELLVVLAIIGVLLALLFPAIQSVRSTAYRNTCGNNLRQISLAVQHYSAIHGAFPTGVSVEDGNSPQLYLTWLARILPEIEQQHIWSDIERAFAQDRNYRHVPPHNHRFDVITTFSCPADSRSLAPSTRLGIPIAFTSYVGVAGRRSQVKNGVLYADSKTQIGDITDGTSTTLLAGERPPSADEQGGWWYAGDGVDREGSVETIMGVREVNLGAYRECTRGPYKFGPGAFDNVCDAFHFWSPHPGGANFAFCDGSVRFLAYSADPIMPALATRAGGEAVSVPD